MPTDRTHTEHGREQDVLELEHPYRDIALRPFGLPSDLVDRVGHDHPAADPDIFRKFSDLIGDRAAILSVVEFLTRREASPWAVIVVTFNDDPKPSGDLAPYESVFTSTGAGTMNMVDYFGDMSHGKLDLSGTKVFGPYVLDRPRSDYVGNTYPQPPGRLNRNGVLDLAKATATAQGVDLSPYAGVVVCGTPQLDLCGWVGGRAALCDDLSLQPSLLGQEMGHGYGLDHSRIVGSDDDYQDAWDTMSTANAYMATHPGYGAVGPGLNAVNMSLRGWLNERRVRTVDPAHADEEVVALRPLHARHLSGTLAVAVGGYFVEFRARSRWDAGIPRACVLVHRAEGNISVLMKGTGGNADLVAGDTFEIGRPGGLFAQHVRVHVESIDEANERAVVRVTYAPLHIPHVPQEEIGQIFGGVKVDGPGFVVINGRVHPVPPRGPERLLVEAVAGYLAATTNPAGRQTALQEVLHGLGAAVRDLEVVSHTPPGLERLQSQLRPQSPA
jgi:hypothetical protein